MSTILFSPMKTLERNVQVLFYCLFEWADYWGLFVRQYQRHLIYQWRRLWCSSIQGLGLKFEGFWLFLRWDLGF
jgi:hypothetical protein